MRDTKAFASLTSGLLARKGQARPAMRPQGFTQGMSQTDDLGWNDMGHDEPRFAGARLSVGLARPQEFAVVDAPAEMPEVLRQQDEIAREFADPIEPGPVAAEAVPIELAPIAEEPAVEAPVVVPARAPRAHRATRPKALAVAPHASGRKAAFTLRLAAERHLMLRLACAVQNRSAQQIVTEALDRLLADLPDVARLAASLPHQD